MYIVWSLSDGHCACLVAVVDKFFAQVEQTFLFEMYTAQNKLRITTITHMSRVMRKPDFCLCENKGADQLRSNCEADQRLCFRYTDSTLSLLIKSELSSFYAASGTVHVGLCQTWLETPKTGFLASRLIYHSTGT